MRICPHIWVMVLGFTSLFGCGVPETTTIGEADTLVIYGSDDRKDPWQPGISETLRTAAQSTALVTDKAALTPINSSYSRLKTEAYAINNNLCSEEPFANQLTGGWCSAFLVAPDLLATAGHCIQDERICANAAFVFDFRYESESSSDIDVIASENVYYCSKILDRKYSQNNSDYAVIQLDRPVVGREPLKLRRAGEIDSSAVVAAIGHPSGLAQKITDNGTLRAGGNEFFFRVNLDTYGGNSGSAVINVASGEVEGILVRGEQDFKYTDRGCMVSFKCDEGTCRGEDVVRASNFSHLIP